ncbi:MAG TPA: ABC transporter ATP-binding protein [Gaiellaceae bacterium]|nr:ABC transporter ATP-binding protein [Gaiellaceae bacterium]
MNAGAPAIRLAGVSKRFGSHVALEPTDLEIGEGEFFCLLGPSGCGKTTTLNLIGGFVNATSGEIYIRDQRVNGLPPHRRSVNTVFQSYALFPHMTVRANVGFGLKMARVPGAEARGRIEEALRLVGLEEFGERLPGQLSGGQQQRVAVARALVNRPAVLLLDEPLGALDLKLRQRLQVELAQIHRDVGTTFVYVTHDQEEAMSMATRIAVMNRGAIRQIGTPSEIYYRPRSRFVADFIGESNFLEVDASEAGRGVARLGDGRRVPCAANGWAGGARATLMVRPEFVQVGDPLEAPEASLRGRIVQTSFLGSQTRVAVRCDAVEAPVTASKFGRDRAAARDLAPDREVALWWDSEDAILLPEESTDEGGE